jgi:hypothetical protein
MSLWVSRPGPRDRRAKGESVTSKYGPHHLGRSAGPEDVTSEIAWTGGPKWLLDSAIRSLGPYVEYPDGSVTDRASGRLLWKPGDPGKPPKNPERGRYNKPRTIRRGLV